MFRQFSHFIALMGTAAFFKFGTRRFGNAYYPARRASFFFRKLFGVINIGLLRRIFCRQFYYPAVTETSVLYSHLRRVCGDDIHRYPHVTDFPIAMGVADFAFFFTAYFFPRR